MNKIIYDKEEKKRVDIFLKEQLSFSRAKIQKAIENKKVLVNGKIVSSSFILKTGDIIEYEIIEDERIDILPSYFDSIDYVYKDNDIAIINKKRGLVVHPSCGHYDDSLVNLLLGDEDFKYDNSSIRPGIIHRIDKDTQGLLLVSLNPDNMDFLSKCIKDHLFEREYLALVYGKIEHEYFKIDAPLTKPNHTNRKAVVDVYNGNEAITHCHLLSTTGKVSLISCKLETGRTHQIRAHLAYINHPLVGDPIYSNIKNDVFDQGQVLSAIRLSIIHPKTLDKMIFTAPIDDYFKKALKYFY